MRRSILVATALLSFAITSGSSRQPCLAQEALSPSAVGPRLSALLDSSPREPADGDSELTKLMKARFNAAVGELNARHDGVLRGSYLLDQLYDAGRRLLEAELALTENAEEQVAVLEKTIAVIEEFEQRVEQQVEAGLGATAELYRIRYEKLGLMIDLLKLKEQ